MTDHVNTSPRSRGRMRLLGWIALASMLALIVLGPAAGGASAHTQLAQSTPISSSAAGFQGSDEECDGANLAPGEVLWHFVLVQTDAAKAGSTLTATFVTAGSVTVDAAKKTGHVLHFNVITGTDTLLGAVTNRDGSRLNLSHICSGGTITTTTSTSTSTSTSSTTTN